MRWYMTKFWPSGAPVSITTTIRAKFGVQDYIHRDTFLTKFCFDRYILSLLSCRAKYRHNTALFDQITVLIGEGACPVQQPLLYRALAFTNQDSFGIRQCNQCSHGVLFYAKFQLMSSVYIIMYDHLTGQILPILEQSGEGAPVLTPFADHGQIWHVHPYNLVCLSAKFHSGRFTVSLWRRENCEFYRIFNFNILWCSDILIIKIILVLVLVSFQSNHFYFI